MIYRAGNGDISRLTDMALKLWPDNDWDELFEEMKEIIAMDDAAVFILAEDGKDAGFAQCQLRNDYVEGTDTSPVGYLEGIFVDENFRGRGFAADLLRECEKWTREMGCSEIASDCDIDNEASFRFHLKHGFIEVNRIICFSKKI